MQDIELDRIVIPADMTLKQNNSGNRAFQCPDVRCGRRFNRKYTLTEHMKTHTGERPHVCRARGCGKRFSTSGNLSRHMRLHGAIEPVHCPVKGCTSKFMSDIKLAKHMRTHYYHGQPQPPPQEPAHRTGTREVQDASAVFADFELHLQHPSNQKCSTPTRESPTGIDQEWTGNAWELASESIELELPAPFESSCTTPWTPEMLDILSKMLLD
ncbi:hypothetical protein AM588_10010694 [Phytophthora nicotianae]|uniref:C2H2-type domain-containing protein n=1 Tax=Phytophthora nicotianae TaxID=4792 RepID=A0A0W8DMZ4_PHYNI|nr:hypothetical protein AM588_10010694 [Phytophthora nicotianae]